MKTRGKVQACLSMVAWIAALALALAGVGTARAQDDAIRGQDDGTTPPTTDTLSVFDVTTPFLGWGGPGGQVFARAISIARNNPSHPREVMVIADDLMVRGPKAPLLRCVVIYEAPRDPNTGQWLGTGMKDTVASAVFERRFEYPLRPLYPTPFSPRSAIVVLPQGNGLSMRVMFHRTRLPTFDRSQDRDEVFAFTRSIPLETILALPVINPLREYAMRRHKPDPAADDGG